MTSVSSNRVLLTQEYAAYAEARTALGTAWAGVIALWPLWGSFAAWAFGATDGWVRYWLQFKLALFAPLAWVVGRTCIARWYYRPIGEVRLKREQGERLWNGLILSLLILAVAWGYLTHWMHLVSVAWPLPNAISPLRNGGLALLWLVQVAWIGFRKVHGWEERLVFFWVGLFGGIHLVPTRMPYSLTLVVQAIGMLALFLAPVLMVWGLRGHLRFRRILQNIQALPSIEA